MKKYILPTLAVLASASFVNAQDALSVPSTHKDPFGSLTLSAELVFADSQKKEVSDGHKIDQGGLNLILGGIPVQVPYEGIKVTAFGLLGFYSGEREETHRAPWGAWGKEEETKKNFRMAAGLRADKALSEEVSFYGRAHLGFDYFTFEYEYSEPGHSEKGDDSDIGIAYGLGIGMHWQINPRHAVSLGADYIGSTARPKIEGTKIKAQTYTTLSIGYTYSF